MSHPEVADFQPDLHAYEFENDPVPTLNRLRAEDPVHWSRHGFWFLTRYEHVSAVLKDPKRFSSAAAGWGDSNPLARGSGDDGQSRAERGLSRSLAHSFNQMDAPNHTRIRALVQAAFSRRAVEERVSEHEQGLLPGYTFARRPLKLVFSEPYERVDDAIAAERRLKGWSRAKKEAYMRGDFASLVALAKRGAKTAR